MNLSESRPLRAVFVSGTGTDVGKTVVVAALLRALRIAGVAAQAVKPVQTGVNSASVLTASDVAVYTAATADIPPVPAVAPATVLRCFALPASPRLAAAAEGICLQATALCGDIRQHWRAAAAEILLLESAGGICAPFNGTEDMRDVAAGLGIPVVIVCANCLGALSQLFCALSAMTEKGLNLAGIVMADAPFSRNSASAIQISDDNLSVARERLARMGRRVPVVGLPRQAKLDIAGWSILATLLAPLAETIRAALPKKQDTDLTLRDHAVVWHPYASALDPPVLHVAARSCGNRITLEDGRELVDGMSSWWAAVHGYNHPRLLDALRRQAGRMPHVMFGGLTHAPAVKLAEALIARMPRGLSRVFFADSGSVAMEVAMKMALQCQLGRGQTWRGRFLAPRGGYHGDTLGVMSICDPVTGMHSLFAEALPRQIFTERPACRFDEPFDPACLDDVRHIFETRGEELAAVVLEPVVQGAVGMWFYHPGYLRGLAQLCREAGVLLIFDEIATGFGRTGKFFAAQWAGVSPDILCCGKALTGGVLTLAATVCTGEVAAGICGGGRVFMHGPTFMGNPLACAVALASLELLEENHWEAQVATVRDALAEGLEPCRGLPDVADVRVLGAIGVVEMREPVNTAALQNFFVNKGVWIRPFNRLIYLMPPYISPAEDVARLCTAIEGAVNGRVHKL
ncbi:MAG: adenosylmethionine--8-amino-7-oxononanoate transaminase [Desulfovibrio sp.]|nr:adenosylmethionine--8-amino-7-oxononanoate transaminase [Desulfovibrio sp.]